jgi:nitrite reductase/ring-hydroxylating ferredoxin subunit/uncharacterized membrane protein
MDLPEDRDVSRPVFTQRTEGFMAVNRVDSVRTRLLTRVEEAAQLDEPARQVRAILKKMVAPAPIRRLLSGTDLGHPVHPVLVQIPIGCWSSAWILDLMGLGETKAARRLVGLGVLAAFPTLASGASDWVDTDGAEARVGLVHAASNSMALACFATSWLRKRNNRHSGAVWSTIGVAVATVGGLLGGHLAYGLGVGVDTNAFETGPEEWTPVRGNVPSEPLVARTADGVRVMVAQSELGRFALADRCSHRGGPLSEGSLGPDCVTCPWHGSRFDLKTGIATRGPASIPQPVYESRVRKDRLELRRREHRALRQRSV